MGKSSLKPKRSKYSSQGRARKRKDTRRSKSKKLRRRDDSESYSDDDSRCSLSVSSFDSEDSYRSRRSRSRTRMDVRGGKKRSCARSSSNEESPHLRKKKRSKRNDERKKTLEKKTKKRRKKKARRDSSFSSSSSESWSCSTCQSDESEHKRRKGRPDRREDEKRKSENIKSGAKRRRHRSRSCSSCSRHDGNSDFLTSNVIIGENTSKRLRSVIILPGEDNEVRERDKDKHKEEITYDHDDYPSSRSNDSNEGLNNMEKRPIEDEKREDDAASNIQAIELTESDKVGEGQHTRNKPGYDIDKVGTNDTKKEKNEVSGVIVDSVKGDDLETILRQRALENLKSFRSGLGGFRRNAKSAVLKKDKCDGTVKAPSPAMPELGQIKSPKNDGARMVREDSAHSPQNEKIADVGICGSESSSAKNNVHPPDQVAIPGREKVITIASSRKNKPRLITSALRQASSNSTTTLKETPALQEANQAKLVSGSSVGKSATPTETSASRAANPEKLVSGISIGKSATLKETPASWEANHAKLASGSSLGKNATLKEIPASREANQAKLGNGSNVGKNATHDAHTVASPTGNDNDDKASVSAPAEPSSCLTSAAGDISLNKSQDEGKEGSQFEQKTMSVMRGGEMVQVNYKVYIPKKTPPLARRQLKR